MKKIMLLAAFAAIFAACSKNEAAPGPETKGIPMHVSFAGAGGQFDTRAFFDDTADAEPWEKEVKTLHIYAFSETGKVLMVKEFTKTEISNLQGIVYLPESYTGRTVNIHVVANYDRQTLNNVTTEANAFARTTVSDDHSYNSSFKTVTTGCPRAGGFTMTGSGTVTLSPEGEMSYIHLVLKRVVAKIAIEVAHAPGFAANHAGGKICLTDGGISNADDRCYLIPNGTNPSGAVKSIISQKSTETHADKFQFLVYIFEQQPSDNEAEWPEFYLNGYFDQDGKISTNDDRKPITYRVPLAGSGKGEIKRNGYYRIKGTLSGFDALLLESSVEIAEWETPETTDVGNIHITQ